MLLLVGRMLGLRHARIAFPGGKEANYLIDLLYQIIARLSQSDRDGGHFSFGKELRCTWK